MPLFASLTAARKKLSAELSATAENPARRFNTEDVSTQLQRALAPLQIESLSLHDAAGELMWRNDGAFGDDEQVVVLDALDVFALDDAREDLRLKLDDDRSALFACARDVSRQIRGVGLLIVESPQDEELAARLSAPRLTSQLRRFAQLLQPPAPGTGVTGSPTAAEAASTKPLSASPPAATAPSVGADIAETQYVPRAPIGADIFTVSPDASQAYPADPAVTQPALAQPIFAQTLSLEVEPIALAAAAPVRVERRARPAVDDKERARSNSIRARRYTRLRAGGAARRYEVKLSSGASFNGDLALTTLVAEHVQRSLERYSQAPTTFAVPLSVESVTEQGWLAKLEPVLIRIGVPRGMLGFSLSPDAWLHQQEASGYFLAECVAAGCFVALDDFSLEHSGLALLRSAAVKCLKLNARLIRDVRTDRFTHATLVATVQAARVLGLYCVAKQVTSASQVQWLASAGIEFADGVSRGVVIAGVTHGE